jgi:hypothetical protein
MFRTSRRRNASEHVGFRDADRSQAALLHAIRPVFLAMTIVMRWQPLNTRPLVGDDSLATLS